MASGEYGLEDGGPGGDAPLRLVDTHAHLDEPAFDADRDDVLRRAAEAGVGRVVNVGYRPGRWETTAALTAGHAGISPMFGLHPQHADEFDDRTLATLEGLIRDHGGVAVGEVGLDYFRDGPDPAVQRRVFEAQLALADGLGLPAVIHQRAAEEDCAAVLAAAPRSLRVVLHSFDAGWRLAALALDRGWFFGVGGLMTRAKAEAVRAVLSEVPLERMVLETDSPYLAPAGAKERRNTPASIPVIAARLAALRGVGLDEVARATTGNAEALFGGDPRSDRTEVGR
jgi:TatD DNase family protein